MPPEQYSDGEEFLEELEYDENGELHYTQRAMKARVTVSELISNSFCEPHRRL